MTEQAKLTKRQREIYEFIAEKIRARGYGPTVREIGSAFDIKSPNGVMCHLQALVKKGLIIREPNMSRAISIVNQRELDPGIPLAGTIAAGSPIETYEQTEASISVHVRTRRALCSQGARPIHDRRPHRRRRFRDRPKSRDLARRANGRCTCRGF